VEHKDAAPQTEKTAGKPSPSTNLQTMPSGILRIDADASLTAAIHPKEGDDPNVDIAILDTGIDGRHGDLNVAGGYNCTGRNTNAWGDRNGHGTHVAGTAAAKDNGSGVVGVAPGARLWAIKTLDGDGALSDHICGLDWITTQNSDSSTDNDIEVANYSGGGEGSDSANCGRDLTKGPDDPGYIVDPRHHATCSMVEAGVVFVASAGNIRRDLAEQQPATYNEVIAVTAIADYDGDWVLPKAPVPSGCTDQGDDDTAATFTNYAGKSDDHGHTIAAPGVCIRSTDKRGGYATASGTSMSSPHVAGTAALCIAGKQCVADPSEVMTNMAKLIGDAKTRNDTSAPYYGFAQAPSDPSDGAKYYGYLVTAKDY
jgi:subtilisin family serine protease